jgi:hypothetical protein
MSGRSPPSGAREITLVKSHLQLLKLHAFNTLMIDEARSEEKVLPVDNALQ